MTPYLLPLPMPASPVVLPHLAVAVHADLNGRYADPIWSLAPLTGNPSMVKPRIRWERWPEAGQLGRHLIRGREFKTATDEYGNHLPSGAERDVPWVAVTPVVAAIRVLERMVPAGHLLFDYSIHDPHGRAGTGR